MAMLVGWKVARVCLLSALASTLIVVAAGCDDSGDDASPTSQPTRLETTGPSSPWDSAYVDAMVRDFDPSIHGFSPDEGVCIAREILDAVGADSLQSAGVVPANIPGFSDLASPFLGAYVPTDEQRQMIAEMLAACVDFVGLTLGWYPGIPRLSAEANLCIERSLLDDQTFKLGVSGVILRTGSRLSNSIPMTFLASALRACSVVLPRATVP